MKLTENQLRKIIQETDSVSDLTRKTLSSLDWLTRSVRGGVVSYEDLVRIKKTIDELFSSLE